MESSDDVSRRSAWHLNRRSLGRLTLAGAMAGGVWATACGQVRPSAASKTGNAGQPLQAKYGGQLNIPTTRDPYDYDPTHDPWTNSVPISVAYDSLLRTKAGPGVKYTDLILEPWLADRWETPDAQTFTFHLRQGVRFADLPPVNGRAVTSADVKWSLEYLANTGEIEGKTVRPATNAPLFQGLDSIETPDAATATVRFKQPFIPFLTYVAVEWNPMLAHEVFDQDGSFAKHLVGTGPWQLDTASSQKGSHWVFKKNPTYFQPGKPYLDQLNFLVIPDDETRYAAFRAKQLDFAPNDSLTGLMDVPAVQQLERDNPAAIVYQYLANGCGYIYENVRQGPLADLRVRRAIALSVDRDTLIRTFAGGKGTWALAGGEQGLFTDEETKQILKYDPAQARQLLSAAGYPQGIEFDFLMGTSYGQDVISLLQLVQSQLKQANINVTLNPVDAATLEQYRRAHDFQLDFDPRSLDSDIDSYLFSFYSTAPGNEDGVNDPQLDQLVLQQRRETDPTKRTAVLRQAVQRIADQSWGTSLYYGSAYLFWQPHVKNFVPNYSHHSFPLIDTWVDT